jgi:uroporphyrinogen III methyltransferase/synthase
VVGATRHASYHPAVTVHLVGAGPGDPGLLTVRGAQVLRSADVVVYDRLSIGSLLDLAPAGAERINVGKAPGHPTMPQEDINALLVERGLAGQRVVRLKGGDPFVFARGGEEALALMGAGVPFEVVPGITSAIAVPAYAGIPVTQRHSSELFTVITGHEDPAKGGELDWETVAKLGGTIIVMMGIGRLPKIIDRLLAGGLASTTPVAVVRWGTRPEQHSVRATLGTILDHELASPSVIVIGKVAALNLGWFESRPLFGRTVVVTRAREQASALVDLLRLHGADTVEVPIIRIAPPADGGVACRDAAARAHTFDWVVLTSANGVARFMDGLRDARDLGGVKVAAIGPGTADALRDRNVVADLVPERFVAESLLDAFPGPGSHGGRVLLARAAVARDVLPDGLRERGWDVEVVEAYRTEPVTVTDDDHVRAARADIVTFTSSSTVDRYLDAMGDRAVPPTVACIGPVTAATARQRGLTVDVEAAVHTIEGLVDALVAHATRPENHPEGIR